MTIESPLFLQDGSTEYSARETRRLIEAVLPEGVVGAASYAVSERAIGANLSVDVAAGLAVVEGDDQTRQGHYLVSSTAVENVAVAAPPGSNSRIDLVVLQVRDSQAGGDAGDDAVVAVVTGTASATPVAPDVPDTALVLAEILVTSASAAVTDSMLTDRRVEVSPVRASLVDAAGDLLVGTGVGTVDRLALGAGATVLTSVGGAPLWAAPAKPVFYGWEVTYANGVDATGTSVEVPWNTEIIDTHGFHSNSVNPERVTIPAGLAGYYALTVHVRGSTANIAMGVQKNGGGSNLVFARAVGAGALAHATRVVYLNAGDYLKSFVLDGVTFTNDDFFFAGRLVGV